MQCSHLFRATPRRGPAETPLDTKPTPRTGRQALIERARPDLETLRTTRRIRPQSSIRHVCALQETSARATLLVVMCGCGVNRCERVAVDLSRWKVRQQSRPKSSFGPLDLSHAK